MNQGSEPGQGPDVLAALERGAGDPKQEDERSGTAQLGDGLGEAAEDLTPGSRFLRDLNRRPRRSGVSYHILAGDAPGLCRPKPGGSVEKRIDSLEERGGDFWGV